MPSTFFRPPSACAGYPDRFVLPQELLPYPSALLVQGSWATPLAAVVRRLAGGEHSVQSVDAGGEQVDFRKVWQVHFGLLLSATRSRPQFGAGQRSPFMPHAVG